MSKWVAVSKTMIDCVEVLEMAETLDINPDAVMGKLFRLWVWTERHGFEQGGPVSVPAPVVDRLVRCPGFVRAMAKAGWYCTNKSGDYLFRDTRGGLTDGR